LGFFGKEKSVALHIPNEADAAFANQAELSSTTIDAVVAGFRQDGVIAGVNNDCDLEFVSVLKFRVKTGSVRKDGVPFALSSTAADRDADIEAGDATNDRWDLIVYDTVGGVEVVKGTAAAQPVIKALDVDQVALWAVFVPKNTTTFDRMDDQEVATYAVDHRIILRSPAGVVNVMDHGAVGDGVADDTAAIQAAMDAAGLFGAIFLPPGEFAIGGSGLNVKMPLSIIGSGGGMNGGTATNRAPTKLRALDSLDGYVLDTSPNTAGLTEGGIWSGFQIWGGFNPGLTTAGTGPGGLPNKNGIYLNEVGHFTMYDVTVDRLPGYGIRIRDCLEFQFWNVNVHHCGTCGDNAKAGTSSTTTKTFVQGKDYTPNALTGAWLVNLTRGTSVKITSNAASDITHNTVGSGNAALNNDNLAIVFAGTTDSTGNSTTVLKDAGLAVADDQFNDWVLLSLSGSGSQQAVTVTDTVGGTPDQLTFPALTDAIANSSKYLICKPAIVFSYQNGDTFPPSNWSWYGSHIDVARAPFVLMYSENEAKPNIHGVFSGVHFEGSGAPSGTPKPMTQCPTSMIILVDCIDIKFEGCNFHHCPRDGNVTDINIGSGFIDIWARRIGHDSNKSGGVHIGPACRFAIVGNGAGSSYGVILREGVSNLSFGHAIHTNYWEKISGLTALVRNETNGGGASAATRSLIMPQTMDANYTILSNTGNIRDLSGL
jgi:hypothetical protein